MSIPADESYPAEAIALPEESLSADVVIVGSGMGGGTLAWALKDVGLDAVSYTHLTLPTTPYV